MFQIYRYFAGWGNLVFFDPKEHQITDKKVLLASIPKLEAQWKIIHEIKTTGYPEYPVPASLTLEMTNHTMEFEFDSHLGCPDFSDLVFGPPIGMEQLPKLPEWTRIEISHVEEGGQYFLSITVGVREERREGEEERGMQASELNLGNLTDVKIYSGNDYQHQPRFVKGLMVLDQQ